MERRIKAATCPDAVKSLDSFDFKAMPSLNKMLVMADGALCSKEAATHVETDI